jgi:histidyl-tRNA synthetase
MRALQPARGTRDLLPADMRRHRHVVDTARAIAERYGYAEMATPVFEFTEVFARGMGETSDVVSKEMYSFADKGGDNLTLRPEYTAGICRAFVANGLHQLVPFKVFAEGPMFRFERPQKGRQRQFHQIDVEVLGAAEPAADVEVIVLAAAILEALEALGKCTLEINSLGDTESRRNYRAALVDYFGARRDRLSEDSQRRLGVNPLRILDSKDQGDRELIKDAPLIGDYWNAASRDFFAAVRRGLEQLGVAHAVQPRLVRGLDYYTHTAFEFTTRELGAQGAVIAGGRYDGLVEALGGPPTPGIGWAGGVERLALLAGKEAPALRPVALVPMGEAAEAAALTLAQSLRRAGMAVELAYKGDISKRMKRAGRVGARLAVIIGDAELQGGVATIRDLDSGTQSVTPLATLAGVLARRT